jgi:hypothetical protein
MFLLTIHSTSTRPSRTQNFYKQKHFCLTDLSNTFVFSVLIVKHDNSDCHSSQMDNVWSTQHGFFVYNKTGFLIFLSSFERCLLPNFAKCLVPIKIYWLTQPWIFSQSIQNKPKMIWNLSTHRPFTTVVRQNNTVVRQNNNKTKLLFCFVVLLDSSFTSPPVANNNKQVFTNSSEKELDNFLWNGRFVWRCQFT